MFVLSHLVLSPPNCHVFTKPEPAVTTATTAYRLDNVFPTCTRHKRSEHVSRYTSSLNRRSSRRNYDGPRRLIHHRCNIRREAIFSLASTHLERFVAGFEHQQVVLACPTHIKGSPGTNDSSRPPGAPKVSHTFSSSIGDSSAIMSRSPIRASSSSGNSFSTTLA